MKLIKCIKQCCVEVNLRTEHLAYDFFDLHKTCIFA